MEEHESREAEEALDSLRGHAARLRLSFDRTRLLRLRSPAAESVPYSKLNSIRNPSTKASPPRFWPSTFALMR